MLRRTSKISAALTRVICVFIAFASCLGVVVLPSAGTAQSIQIEPQSRRIAMDEFLEVQIRLEGQFDGFREPALDDWVVRQQSTSRFTSITNGVVRKERVLNLTLEPRKPGKLVIGAAHLVTRGNVVASSAPVQIEVLTPEPISSTRATDLNIHRNESLFILPNLSDEQPYEGEPIVLTFDLYVQSRLRIQQKKGAKPPDLSGFAVTDVSPKQTLKRSKRMGRHSYDVYTLKRDILVPLNAGIHTIDPLQMTLLVTETFNRRHINVKSELFNVDVLPIPEEGRPDSYRSGNIGLFTMEAKTENQKIRLGKREILTLSIRGRGNLRSIKEPSLPKIPGLDVERLEGDEMKDVIVDATGMYGTVAFTYMVTPRRVGDITIPALTLGFFDPETGSYKETRSQPLTLSIPGMGNTPTNVGTLPQGNAHPMESQEDPGLDLESALKALIMTLEETHPIVLSTNEEPPFLGSDKKRNLFWILFAFPPLLLLAHIGLDHSRNFRVRGAPQRKERRALSLAKTEIRRLEKAKSPADAETFYQSVNTILTSYLSDRLGLAPTAMTRVHLEQWLRQHEFPASLIEDLIAEMENCDFARFAPASNQEEGMRTCLERTLSLLNRINEHAKGVSYV